MKGFRLTQWLALFCLALPAMVWAASTALQDLTEKTSPSVADQFYCINGSNASKRMTFDTFQKGITNMTSWTASGQYAATEYVASNVTGTYTVNWTNGNCQYMNLTGNTTFTFSDPKPGARYLLSLGYSGNYTPTLPNSTYVSWPSATTPTWSALANIVDKIALYYSGVNSKYAGVASLNFTQ